MGSSISHRVLPGLPGEGPLPLLFSARGQGQHREGFVVEFQSATSKSWVGNFQPGLTSLNAVLALPDDKQHVVISGGQGYVVSTETGQLNAKFGGSIEWFKELPHAHAILVSNGISVSLWRGSELVWQSRRLSWDGMRNLSIDSNVLNGQAWCYDETWHEFTIDLSTGASTGGAYDEPRP